MNYVSRSGGWFVHENAFQLINLFFEKRETNTFPERLAASCLRYITRRIENLTIARINFFKLISNRLWSILSFFKPLFSLMDWENALRNVLLFLLFLCLCLLLSVFTKRNIVFSRWRDIDGEKRKAGDETGEKFCPLNHEPLTPRILKDPAYLRRNDKSEGKL